MNTDVSETIQAIMMNAAISETIKAAILGLDIQILQIPGQRRVSSGCNAHKPPKTVSFIVLTLEQQFQM